MNGREIQSLGRTVVEETSRIKIFLELAAEELVGAQRPVLLTNYFVEHCWVLDGTGHQLQHSLNQGDGRSHS